MPIEIPTNPATALRALPPNADGCGLVGFGWIVMKTGLDLASASRACRTLARSSPASDACGLWADDGPAGAVYGVTAAGERARRRTPSP